MRTWTFVWLTLASLRRSTTVTITDRGGSQRCLWNGSPSKAWLIESTPPRATWLVQCPWNKSGCFYGYCLSSAWWSLCLWISVVVRGHHVGDCHSGPDSISRGGKQWDLWLLETGKPSETASGLSRLHVSVSCTFIAVNNEPQKCLVYAAFFPSCGKNLLNWMGNSNLSVYV